VVIEIEVSINNKRQSFGGQKKSDTFLLFRVTLNFDIKHFHDISIINGELSVNIGHVDSEPFILIIDVANVEFLDTFEELWQQNLVQHRNSFGLDSHLNTSSATC
jgi:hypothetical protein